MSGKAAVIQMTSSVSVEKNLQQAQQLIAEAAEQGAQLVVLPEMWATMVAGDPQKVEIAEVAGDGQVQEFMAEQARVNELWIVGGTIPIQADDPKKIRAACITYNTQGDVVARYDKIHLFDAAITPGEEEYRESAITEPGDEVIILETPIGRLGVAVCYDIRFPELFRVLFNYGVEVFAIPAAFTVTTGKAHWQLLAQARAIENFSYVLGACQYGKHDNGRKTFGSSCIIDPWGQVVEKMARGTGVLSAEIDLDYLRTLRSNMPIAEHRRISEI